MALRAIMRRDRTRNASAGFGSGTSSILVFNDVEKDKRAEKESGLVVVDLKPIFPGQDLLESPMP